MEVIVAYIIFTIVVSLVLLYNVYIPIFKMLSLKEPQPLVVSNSLNKFVALSTLTLGSVLFAPILVFPALFKSSQNNYYNALYNSLLD